MRYWMRRRAERLMLWIVWRLPKRLVMWCYIRVAAHATTGEHENTSITQLGMMDALSRWPGTN